MAYSYLNFGNNIVPQSINDTGEVAGYVLGNRFSGDSAFSYTYRTGVINLTSPPSAYFTVAAAVNDSGTIAGYYYNLTTQTDFGFTYSGGSYKIISVGIAGTAVSDLNNSG